jgi:diguanylate cyclase (GGDEF)-like protein
MLDLTTVFIYSSALTLFVCIVTFIACRTGEADSETRNWFIASVLQLSGTIFMSIGDYVPLGIGGYFGGIASVAATGYLALGYRQLYGQRATQIPVLATAIVFGTAIYLTKLLSDNHEDGIWLIYAGGAVNLSIAAAAIWKGMRSQPSAFGRIAAWMLSAYAAAYAAVAPISFFFPITFVDGKPVSSWLQATTIPLVLLNLGAYLMTMILKLERSTERQRHLALHDGLTGALNRRAFYERAALCTQGSSILAIIDLDYFKQVNDTHGHHAGDEALQLFSNTVMGAIPANAFFGRLGGEEFALGLPGLARPQAEALLERLRLDIAALRIIPRGERVFSITFSCGFTEFGGIDEDQDRIFAEADRALYAAKSQGRNRIVAFDPALLLEHEARQLRLFTADTMAPRSAAV